MKGRWTVVSRAPLDRSVAESTERLGARVAPHPAHTDGYVLARLQDRVRYRREGAGR